MPTNEKHEITTMWVMSLKLKNRSTSFIGHGPQNLWNNWPTWCKKFSLWDASCFSVGTLLSLRPILTLSQEEKEKTAKFPKLKVSSHPERLALLWMSAGLLTRGFIQKRAQQHGVWNWPVFEQKMRDKLWIHVFSHAVSSNLIVKSVMSTWWIIVQCVL